jgi:hypothetical protein
MMFLSRRQAVMMGLAMPLVPLAGGCRASLPPWPAADSSGESLSLLRASAAAHGLSAYGAINDLNVSYAGHWRRLVGKIQPVLVDSGFRGGSEERLLLRDGTLAQSHSGPKGHKQVVRSFGANGNSSVRVWFNGNETLDRDRTDAAALVVDAYSLFLLGPILLTVNECRRRDVQTASAGSTEIEVNGQRRLCDLVNLKLSPGFGNSTADQAALYIDRETRLMLRVRMTINGLESTRGALVEIETCEHQSVHGIMWPTAFHERLLRPAPLDVHAWRLTGLDINRGESLSEVSGPDLTGKAVAPAARLSPRA